MLDRVLKYAYEHKAIGAVPTDVIDRSAMHYAVGDDTGFDHIRLRRRKPPWPRRWLSGIRCMRLSGAKRPQSR